MNGEVNELLDEVDKIYGAKKCKAELKKYIDYIHLRKEEKIDFGNFNMIINNQSIYTEETKKIIKIVEKILKINELISDEYYVQSLRNQKLKDISKLENSLITIDTHVIKECIFNFRENIAKLIKENPDNIFIIIENTIDENFLGNVEEFNVVLGEYMTWNIMIEKVDTNDKIDYMKKFAKKNELKITEKSIDLLKEKPYRNVKKVMFDLLIDAKTKNIKTISNKKVKAEIENSKDKTEKNNKERNNKAKSTQSGMDELNSLIGLTEVKKQVNQVLNYIKVNKQRGKMPMLHMCFNGNPGTGKTTVARIIGKIFAENKILSDKDIFVETSREELVGKYVGWTAQQTRKKIEEADGGVLFIDEAYSLYSDSGDDFGHECISELIKEMENKRNSLCVILAGYTEDMKILIESNPGFESRIQFNINFPDYSTDELYQIFIKMAKDDGYEVSDDVEERLIKYFNIEKNKENFANARCVRNIFEKIKFEQASRVCNNITENINLINGEDVQYVIDNVKSVEKVKIGFMCN